MLILFEHDARFDLEYWGLDFGVHVSVGIRKVMMGKGKGNLYSD
jgi:hypothetical protein